VGDGPVTLSAGQTATLPSGTTVTIPEGFIGTLDGSSIVIRNDGDTSSTYLIEAKGESQEEVVANSWELAHPGLEPKQTEADELPLDEWEIVMGYAYEEFEGHYLDARAYKKGNQHWVFINKIQTDVLDSEVPAVLAFLKSFKVPGVEAIDLKTQEYKSIAGRVQELDRFIASVMATSDLTGLGLAIVEGGKPIITKGYGTRSLHSTLPVDKNTLFGIGSASKSMTTLLMARMVDQKKIHWSSPAQSLYQGFDLGDSDLGKNITMEQLVCNCSGVPPRDGGMMFTSEWSADKIFQDLEKVSPLAPLSAKSFNYNNHLFAAAGHIIGNLGNNVIDPMGYVNLMREEVFLPIDMGRSTADPSLAHSDPNIATGKGLPAADSLRDLGWLVPYAGAGSIFSSAEDMSKYVMMELNNGINAIGTKVVSTKNLQHRRKAQTIIGGDLEYALGWMVTTYKGLSKVAHSGSTSSYGSLLEFYPEKGLGVVLLANGTNGAGNSAIASKIFEFWFGTKEQADNSLTMLQADTEPPEDRSQYDGHPITWIFSQGYTHTAAKESLLAGIIGRHENEYAGIVSILKIRNRYFLSNNHWMLPIESREKNGDTLVVGDDEFTISGESFSIKVDRDKHTYEYQRVQ
jgi:CubicO group peptidase (beta-lactamase class C family)